MIIIIDGDNYAHRARSGFQGRGNFVAFNFFRNLRATVEAFAPSRVYYVRDGAPRDRLNEFPEYKANRHLEEGTPEHAAREEFMRQKALIEDLLERYFPVSVMRHPEHEADDLIYTVVANALKAIEFTIVSSDSDFTQMLSEFRNVRLYNPISKEYASDPGYDYVMWKSLRGDASDNIPGLPGVGDVTATRMMDDPDLLTAVFKSVENMEHYVRNYGLIRLRCLDSKEYRGVTCSTSTRDWDAVRATFEGWHFKSLLKQATWTKFVGTFDPLFGGSR